MRIHLTGVFVDDQRKALRFYTETLGFQAKHDIPLGEHAWITVVSAEAPDGTELLLEPAAHPAVGPYRAALVEDGIPGASFAVDDVEAEYERLVARGVRFVQPPTDRDCCYRGLRRYLRQPDPDPGGEGSTVTIATAPRRPAG